MEATGRGSRSPLIAAVYAAPEEFSFIQAVRLLERALTSVDTHDRTARLVGFDNDPREEAVRLRAALDLGFPTAEIADLEEMGAKPQVAVSFMGLVGVSGVLPNHYSRLVLEAARRNNTAPRDFFDIFNHRALSLFLRAAEKYRQSLSYERAGSAGADAMTGALLALIGLREPSQRPTETVAVETLLFYSGHFSREVRTAQGLQQILSDCFGQQIGVSQYHGRWVTLQPAEQSRFSRQGATDGYSTLGQNAVIGRRVWDVQGSFRLRLGPLDYEQFKRFMPGADDMGILSALTRRYVGPVFSFDVQVTLRAKEVPSLQLTADPNSAARLGWNTWLARSVPGADASDAVFRVEAH